MDQGYIRLWRKSIDGGLIKNHNVWIFWTWCLMKANSKKDYKITVGFQEVILQPGEFIFGRKMATEETGLSEQNIKTCLAFLKKCKNLTIKPTNKFSILSIINWGAYQYVERQINQQSNQHVTSSQPASNHKQEQLNNLTIKKEKKKIKKKPFSPPTPEEVQNYFFENGFTKEAGLDAWKYYDAGNWKDSRGTQVKAWKQKMRGVWFKSENKINHNNVHPINNRNLSRSERNAMECFDFANEGVKNG